MFMRKRQANIRHCARLRGREFHNFALQIHYGWWWYHNTVIPPPFSRVLISELYGGACWVAHKEAKLLRHIIFCWYGCGALNKCEPQEFAPPLILKYTSYLLLLSWYMMITLNLDLIRTQMALMRVQSKMHFKWPFSGPYCPRENSLERRVVGNNIISTAVPGNKNWEHHRA